MKFDVFHLLLDYYDLLLFFIIYILLYNYHVYIF